MVLNEINKSLFVATKRYLFDGWLTECGNRIAYKIHIPKLKQAFIDSRECVCFIFRFYLQFN